MIIMRVVPVLLILLLPAVAGCLSEDGAGPAASSSQEGVSPTTTAADPGNATDTPGGVQAATLLSEAFSFQGKTWTGACLATPAGGQCQAAVAAENQPFALAKDGKPTRFTANVTWTASAPVNQQMYAHLMRVNGSAYSFDPAVDPQVKGASPLVIEWDLSAYPPGTELVFMLLNRQAVGSGPATGFVELAQAYAAEGVFVRTAA